MAYTTSKTWGSEVLTSSDLNTYLRDNMEYLKGVADGVSFSGVEVTREAATTISTGSYTTVSFSAETFDFGGWWSSGSAVTVPAGAIPASYTNIATLIFARTKFASNGTGIRVLRVLKNGSAVTGPTVSAINGEITEMDTSRFTTAAAGDVFSLDVYQNSGGNLDITGTILSIVRFLPAS